MRAQRIKTGFAATVVRTLLRPARLSAPRTDLTGFPSHRGLLLPGFQRVGRPSRCWI
jgi:hypothetical protein